MLSSALQRQNNDNKHAAIIIKNMRSNSPKKNIQNEHLSVFRIVFFVRNKSYHGLLAYELQYSSLDMNNNNKPLASLKSMASDKELSLSKEERAPLLLAQLQQRNAANDTFIRMFLSRIQKKYKFGKNGNPAPTNLTTCPEIIEDKESSEEEDETVISSSRRFLTMEGSSPSSHTLQLAPSNPSSSKQVIKSHRDVHSGQSICSEKKSVTRHKPSDEEGAPAKSAVSEDVGFKKYLKRIYMREVFENKVKPSILQNSKMLGLKDRSLQRISPDKSKCLNIKSFVFGDLHQLQIPEIPIHKQSSIQPQNRGTYQPHTAIKMGNIFLPTISRHSGNAEQNAKVTKVRTEETERTNTRCRDFWLSESSQKVGSSFRISTLQLRKHS